MVDILVRGKTKNCLYRKNGEWIYGYYAKQEDRHIIVDTTKGCFGFGLQVDEKTIGLFTKIIDKKGNKVFEGDIVKVKITQSEDKQTYGDCEYKIGVIVYSEDFALFTCKNNFMNFINWAFNDYEVIGNVQDNPELLNEKENNNET